MRIVITGGAGFLASRLARRLLERGSLTDARGGRRAIDKIILLDIAAPAAIDDARIVPIVGDLADATVVERAITADTDTVFHLAAVVSGQAEADFDIGMRVNLDATRGLLERCRRLAAPPKFVFASSLAVFGGPLPDPVPDDAPLTPQASYGVQKAIGEMLKRTDHKRAHWNVVPGDDKHYARLAVVERVCEAVEAELTGRGFDLTEGAAEQPQTAEETA